MFYWYCFEPWATAVISTPAINHRSWFSSQGLISFSVHWGLVLSWGKIHLHFLALTCSMKRGRREFFYLMKFRVSLGNGRKFPPLTCHTENVVNPVRPNKQMLQMCNNPKCSHQPSNFWKHWGKQISHVKWKTSMLKKCSISLFPWENKDTWLQLCWWLTTYLFLWIFQSGCNLWCIIISYECYENCETVFACIADDLLNLLHFLTLCTRQRDPFYKTNAHALKKAIGFI